MSLELKLIVSNMLLAACAWPSLPGLTLGLRYSLHEINWHLDHGFFDRVLFLKLVHLHCTVGITIQDLRFALIFSRVLTTFRDIYPEHWRYIQLLNSVTRKDVRIGHGPKRRLLLRPGYICIINYQFSLKSEPVWLHQPLIQHPNRTTT